MSVDVKGTVATYSTSNGLVITPDIASQFGSAIGNVITQLFNGSISLGNGFSLTGDTNSATIIGTGSAPPLLSGFTVKAIFDDASGDVGEVSLTFTATITSDITLSDAWPSLLSSYPFTDVVLNSGTMTITVDPGDSSYKMKLVPAITFEGESLSSTGLLEIQYVDSVLGFLGGAVVTGTWTIAKDLPVVGTLTLSGDVGAFFSTITETDLSDFSAFPFVPDQVTPGLTVFSQITMGGDLAKIAKFIANNASLQLIVIVPLDGGLSKASVSALLSDNTTTGDFDISKFSLDWQSTSADSGEISLDVAAVINISTTQTLEVIGQGVFTYGDEPSLSLNLELTGNNGAGWVDPFGIPNLTIVDIDFDLTLAVEDGGITIGMSGTIDVGQGDDAVQLSAAAVFDDFEVPIYVSAALSSVDTGKTVSLTTLVDDFLDLSLSSVPLLSSISFGNLSFYACAAPATIGTKTYQPGIGATGDIDFFGYDLDFAFSLITAPKPAVQAKGSISYNGGPIVISGAGVTWLTIGGVGSLPCPSACIDTLASDYCTCSTSVANPYFCIEGSLSILGLASVTVTAAASATLFELDVDLSTSSHILSDKLHIYLDLSSSVFAASNDFNFSPPSITIGPLGVIPQFTIQTPQISCCLALGTTKPASAPCADGWLPPDPAYFHFDLKFSWGALDFNLEADIDITAIANAFDDFGEFIVNWLAQQAEDVLGWIVDAAEYIAKALIQLGTDVADVAKAIVTQLGYAFEDAYNIASDAWDDLQQACGVTTGDSAMQSASSAMGAIQAPITPVPEVLAELAAAPRGQALLTHYYANRAEGDALMRRNPAVMARAQQQIQDHLASPDYQRNAHLPLVMNLIATTAEAASPGYQASAKEVAAILAPYREKSYTELLDVLHSQ